MTKKIIYQFMQNLLIGLGFFYQKKIYSKCSKLYDFCRTIDNIADQNADLKSKKKSLKNLK